ncbi:MAG: YciI family protein [Gemmatimonadota bacterium]|nr:YciI family protein [Gemmatimonadota bacterium]
MKYLCLIYDDEARWGRMSKEEATVGYGKYFTFAESIKSSGHHLNGHPLRPTSTATTVRVRNDTVSATDGPFAETKEQLGGYFLVEARDIAEAVAIAERIPVGDGGAVEVRPILAMPVP